jgi:hypothetical protein
MLPLSLLVPYVYFVLVSFTSLSPSRCHSFWVPEDMLTSAVSNFAGEQNLADCQLRTAELKQARKVPFSPSLDDGRSHGFHGLSGHPG